MSIFVKICGITSEEDALLAVAMGADALGFVFAPSPRQVRPSLVADIIKRLPPEILTVGVFRDETAPRIAEVVHSTGLVGAQLHGNEPPSVVKKVADSVRFVVKSFPAGSRAVRDATLYSADCILIDAPQPGSGTVFDWSLASEIPAGTRLMLAGGLTPANVAQAIEGVRPWAVDVATGVEASPGRKDPVKLRAFVAAAKAVRLDERRRAPTGLEEQGFEERRLEEQPYDWRTEG